MNNTQIEKINKKYLWTDKETGEQGLSDSLSSVFFKERLLDITEVPVEVVRYIQENYVSKEEANKNMRELCQMILDTDKTPRYSYGSKGKNTLNNRGKLAGTGQRWKTPYEIAEDEIRLLDKSKTQEEGGKQ